MPETTSDRCEPGLSITRLSLIEAEGTMLLQEIPEYVQRLATLAVRKRVPGRITVVL